MPRGFSLVDSMRLALQLRAKSAVETFWSSVTKCDVEIRLLERHCDPWLVTAASVFVDGASVASIREGASGILAQVHASAPSLITAMPSGYTQVSVFDVDHRRRRLRGYGLGPALVCTLTKSRDPRKCQIDIIGSRVETVGGIRLAWNTNWPGLGDHLTGSTRV